MHEVIAELFPITRSIAGPGFRESLAILERVCGAMERHRFATGEQVFDWIIPREWVLRDAWIRDPAGRPVVSLANSNLHVVSHSTPVHRRMSLEELQGHLHSLPAQPDAIPYRTSYYHESWGFCLTERQRAELTPGQYEVCIDADLAPGHVELGEIVIPGTSDEEVLFSTYCCHPSMANNELSGPAVVAHLARSLRDRPSPPRLTYRFLFLPETIGAIAYLSRFGEQLRRRLIAGFVVTCVGAPAAFAYKRSRRGDCLADRVARYALAARGSTHRIVDFYPAASDERQYCSPGFNLPVGSLMRGEWGGWPEYHTSLDDLSFVTPAALEQSLDACEHIVDVLEANEVLTVTVPFCEPQLGRRGLYPKTGGGWLSETTVVDLEAMMFLLNFCDGTQDLLAAAERSGRRIEDLAAIAAALRGHDLLS